MRRAIAALGRVLVTIGLLILLFVAFQLWGTGIVTARAQDDMRSEFEDAREAASSTTTTSTTSTSVPADPQPSPPTTSASGPLPPAPVTGEWIGTVRIPAIGVDKIVVEGTGREDLKKGPGHYPGTPLPGQVGNAAIAGHRTTYGQPFYDLDQVEPGDEIITTSVVGEYTYEVREKLIVEPTETQVVDNTPDAQLTLTTCNPRYSARERLVIKAVLVPTKSSPPIASDAFGASDESATELAEGLDGETKSLGPAWGWGVVALVVGLCWWWVFRRWRHPLVLIAGAVPFLIVLFGFYVFLERALPAGY